jgi:two-component system, NtrC family, response regulator HydG
MVKILIIDDDPSFRHTLKTFLTKKKYKPEVVNSGAEGLKALKKSSYAAIILDFYLPDGVGLDMLERFKKTSPNTPVILLTGFADVRTAVKAVKMGAFEYVTKPVDPDELLRVIEGAISNATHDHIKEGADGQEDEVRGDFHYVKGGSKISETISQYIDIVAPTNISVIVQGESGTGKEYVARMIHQKSKRKDKPFVAIDCGALSKDLAGSELFGHVKGAFTGALQEKAGQFEAADGGTLFLDEIGNLSYDIQVKLLRAIQERKIRKIGSTRDVDVDVRLIAATNEDLLKAVMKGSFREDLYHRLNEFKVVVPPLRERKDDIMVFADFFLKQSNEELEKHVEGFSPEVEKVFFEYSWPGNLRELKNIVKRSVLFSFSGVIEQSVLPLEITSDLLDKRGSTLQSSEIHDLKAVSEKNERTMIQNVLEKVRYNKSLAAKMLNIDRKTLYNKLKLYDIVY